MRDEESGQAFRVTALRVEVFWDLKPYPESSQQPDVEEIAGQHEKHGGAHGRAEAPAGTQQEGEGEEEEQGGEQRPEDVFGQGGRLPAIPGFVIEPEDGQQGGQRQGGEKGGQGGRAPGQLRNSGDNDGREQDFEQKDTFPTLPGREAQANPSRLRRIPQNRLRGCLRPNRRKTAAGGASPASSFHQ